MENPYFMSGEIKKLADDHYNKSEKIKESNFKYGSSMEMLDELKKASQLGHPTAAFKVCAILGSPSLGIAMWREGLAWCKFAKDIIDPDIKDAVNLIDRNILNMNLELPKVHIEYSESQYEIIKIEMEKVLAGLSRQG